MSADQRVDWGDANWNGRISSFHAKAGERDFETGFVWVVADDVDDGVFRTSGLGLEIHPESRSGSWLDEHSGGTGDGEIGRIDATLGDL